MRALVLHCGSVSLKTDYPVPEPGSNESLIRVLRAGICETDLQLIQGYMQFQGVLGHEFVGIAQDGPYKGERVVGEINCSCHQCETCRSGLPNHCPRRTVLGILNHDGAFADYIAVPRRNLHRVPAEISNEHAVLTEPLAAAFQIPVQLDLQPSARILVLGAGRLVNLCAQVTKSYGCQVMVIGKHPSKLALLEQLGIEVQLLSQVEPFRDFDVVIACTGSASGLPVALRFVRPRGTIVLKTTLALEQTMSFAPFVIDEIRLVGSRCGPFERALQALKSRHVDVAPLISETYPLSNARLALERARTSDSLKILLDAEESSSG